MTGEDLKSLLTAIASVNGHEQPEAWAQAVLDKLTPPAAEPAAAEPAAPTETQEGA